MSKRSEISGRFSTGRRKIGPSVGSANVTRPEQVELCAALVEAANATASAAREYDRSRTKNPRGKGWRETGTVRRAGGRIKHPD